MQAKGQSGKVVSTPDL